MFPFKTIFEKGSLRFRFYILFGQETALRKDFIVPLNKRKSLILAPQIKSASAFNAVIVLR